MRSNRALLVLHLKDLIARLNLDLATVSFEEAKKILVDGNLVKPGVKADRMTAMLLSYARGQTTDEDVRW